MTDRKKKHNRTPEMDASHREWFLSSEFVGSHVEEFDTSATTAPEPLDGASSPDRAARYEKIALIGEGGMGRVWLGWDTVIERNIAIKEPNHEASPRLVERLQREVLITAKLDHPGVVAVHDIVHDEEARPLFVMALLRGQTLAALLEESMHQPIEHRPSRERLIHHLIDVCEIVSHAHLRGVLHRDLTPRNIIIEDNGTTRLIDWGLAITLDDARRGPGAAGTPGYMSPEQRAGAPLDARSDVWALGALLYTILFHQSPSAPPEHTPSSAIEAICFKAMRAEPEERYANARQMVDDLMRWFEGRRVEAQHMTSWQMARWLFTRHQRTILIGMSILLLTSTILGGSAMFSMREARRAKLAESQALMERQRARAASAQASKQAIVARRSSRDLSLRAVMKALEDGDILEAEKMLEQAEAIAHGPRTMGLRMQLALISKPELEYVRELDFCAGRRILTREPLLQICQLDTTRFEAWRANRRVWVQDISRSMHDLKEANRLKELRVNDDQIVVRLTLRGALSIDLKTGEVRVITREQVRFASTQHTDFLEMATLKWIDHDAAPPCTTQLIHAYRIKATKGAPGDFIYLCQSGEAWREDPRTGARTRIYQGDRSSAHYHVYIAPRDEHWFASSDGTLWPMDHYERRVELGGPLKRMFAIPHTTYIAAQTWGGSWRVLETRQGDWITSFERDVEDLQPSSTGLLQVSTHGRIELWSLPSDQIMRRYKGAHGFTDVAWSLDGRTLGATSSGAQIHHVFPFEDTYIPPLTHGRDVMKSLTPLEEGGFIAVNTMPDEQAPHGLLRFDIVGDRIEPHVLEPDARDRAHGRRVEMLANQDVLMLSSGNTLVGKHKKPVEEGGYENETFDEQGSFHDLDADGSRTRALATGRFTVRFFRDGAHTHDIPAPPGSNYGTIAEDGRYALITRDTLFIQARDGTPQHAIAMPTRPMSLEWRPWSDQIFTGHLDGSVRAWDAVTGELLAELWPHKGLVSSITFSPDNTILTTASWDTTVRLFSLAPLDATRPGPATPTR